MHIMTKVISLSDDAYDLLKGLKQSGDSFSDVVRRVGKETKKKSIMHFAGIWKDKPDIDRAFKQVAKDRKKFKTRDYVLH